MSHEFHFERLDDQIFRQGWSVHIFCFSGMNPIEAILEGLRTALRIQFGENLFQPSHLVSKGFRGGVLRCNLARMTGTNREVYLTIGISFGQFRP